MKMTNEVLMDYVDGTLDAARLAQVEAHLRQNAEDAQMVSDMKMALGALHDWNESEPVHASANFWPALRDKLPAQPGRGGLGAMTSRAGEWLWPRRAPLRFSAGIAALAVFIALAASFLSPQQAVHTVSAKDLTPADMMFIRQSVARHDAYVTSQSLGGGMSSLRSGDGRDGDGDGEDDSPDDGYTP